MLKIIGQSGIVLILEPENLARMKQGDPVTIPDLGLMICYEDMPAPKLAEMLKQKENPLEYLCRGIQVHPDDFTNEKKL